MSIKYFQIMSDGKTVKELTKEEYLKRLQREWNLGWIDNSHLWFTKPMMVTRNTLAQIERLGGWAI